MSHAIQGFVARHDLLRELASPLQHARVVPLEQGFAFLPLTSDLYDEVGDGGKSPYDALWKLSPGMAEVASAWSKRGPVAYVETDYFGGTGDQAAVVFQDGRIVFGPEKGKFGAVREALPGPVSAALRRVGVERGEAYDEFAAAGLHRHRSMDEWDDEEE